MSSKSRLFDTLAKPLAVGALSYLASMLINPSGDIVRLPLIDTAVSVHMFFGITGAASSAIAEPLSNYVLPMLPQSASAAYIEGAVLKPALNASINIAAVYMLYPALFNVVGALKIGGIGAVAQAGGDYVFNQFLHPLLL